MGIPTVADAPARRSVSHVDAGQRGCAARRTSGVLPLQQKEGHHGASGE
jgi:hypothetical protein